MIFLYSNSYAQSMNDLQQLKNEYEQYRTQQNQISPINPAQQDIDPVTGLPRRVEVYPYISLELY